MLVLLVANVAVSSAEHQPVQWACRDHWQYAPLIWTAACAVDPETGTFSQQVTHPMAIIRQATADDHAPLL